MIETAVIRRYRSYVNVFKCVLYLKLHLSCENHNFVDTWYFYLVESYAVVLRSRVLWRVVYDFVKGTTWCVGGDSPGCMYWCMCCIEMLLKNKYREKNYYRLWNRKFSQTRTSRSIFLHAWSDNFLEACDDLGCCIVLVRSSLRFGLWRNYSNSQELYGSAVFWQQAASFPPFWYKPPTSTAVSQGW